ncbi:MAG: M48 family metalloprotease [Planctomycetota bacterium]|nr:M48 family metalloprotease [Planctomycetota bacterium]
MNLPIAFALGLLVLASMRDWYLVLPGSGSLVDALMFAPALLLSPLLLLIARRKSRHTRSRSMQRITVGLAAVALPISYAAFLGPGTWLDWADQLSIGSYLGGAALLLAPLIIVEVLRVITEVFLDKSRAPADSTACLRQRLSLRVVFIVPWLMLAGSTDLLRGHAQVEALLYGTSAGLTLMTLGFVVVLCVLMPLLFRVCFGLRRLAEPAGEELCATAEALSFPRRQVLQLDTGLRIVNALMLGPLPWPRYLVLTDGLLAAIGPDVSALKGVVAHEVGHAKAGHPAMMILGFLIVPLLLSNALPWFDYAGHDAVWYVLPAALAMLLAWRMVRSVGHRFEHEADILSAVALGGAEPCIRALERVGQVLQSDPHRASLLHPSEARRVAVLRRFTEDPAFRARFAAHGLWLRRALVAALLFAALVAMFSWYAIWPIERAIYSYRVGDFGGARMAAEAVGTKIPAGVSNEWESFRQELEVAIRIAPLGGEWPVLRPQMAVVGWHRGVEELLSTGPAAARPWFTLAVEDADRDPLRRSVLLYCEAASAKDLDRMAEVAEHVRRLGVPQELVPVFGN